MYPPIEGQPACIQQILYSIMIRKSPYLCGYNTYIISVANLRVGQTSCYNFLLLGLNTAYYRCLPDALTDASYSMMVFLDGQGPTRSLFSISPPYEIGTMSPHAFTYLLIFGGDETSPEIVTRS